MISWDPPHGSQDLSRYERERERKRGSSLVYVIADFV